MKRDTQPDLAEAYANDLLTLEEFERGIERELRIERELGIKRRIVPHGTLARRAYHSRWLPYTIGVGSIAAIVGGAAVAAAGTASLGLLLLAVGFALFAVLCFGGPDE